MISRFTLPSSVQHKFNNHQIYRPREGKIKYEIIKHTLYYKKKTLIIVFVIHKKPSTYYSLKQIKTLYSITFKSFRHETRCTLNLVFGLRCIQRKR